MLMNRVEAFTCRGEPGHVIAGRAQRVLNFRAGGRVGVDDNYFFGRDVHFGSF